MHKYVYLQEVLCQRFMFESQKDDAVRQQIPKGPPCTEPQS